MCHVLASGMLLLKTGIFSICSLPEGSAGQNKGTHKLVGLHKVEFAALRVSLKFFRLLLFMKNNWRNKKDILNRGDFDS